MFWYLIPIGLVVAIAIIRRLSRTPAGAGTRPVPDVVARISGGVGAIGGIVVAWLLLSELYQAAGDLGRTVAAFLDAFAFGIPLGALLGICAAIVLRRIAKGPAEAKIGAVAGVVVALVGGYPFLLLIPEFVYNYAPGVRVAAMGLICFGFLAAGGAAGDAYSRQAGKTRFVAVAAVVLAGLVVISISSRRTISVHTSSVSELYDRHDAEGLLDKVRNPRLSSSAVFYYVMLAPNEALRSENLTIRYAAAIDLADKRDPSALPVLLHYLRQGDREAARHLSKYRDRRAVKALVSVVARSADPSAAQPAADDLVQAAVYSLGWMGDKSAAPAVEALLLRRAKHGIVGGPIETEAMDALARLDQKRAAALFIGILRDQRGSNETREKAALLLSKMNDPEGRRLAALYRRAK